jgi:hypothetical protein
MPDETHRRDMLGVKPIGNRPLTLGGPSGTLREETPSSNSSATFFCGEDTSVAEKTKNCRKRSY